MTADVTSTHGTMQVLMLGLADEIFAIDAGMVREIIDPVPATRVPGAKSYLPSVLNVRGSVIPLADIRIRFGMERRPNTSESRIVVVELQIDGDPITVGIMADKVYEVTEIFHAQTQQTPRVGLRWNPEYIRFITKWNDEFIIVPDMERILN
jgi:purine-binding chemotaxis protein CheW